MSRSPLRRPAIIAAAVVSIAALGFGGMSAIAAERGALLTVAVENDPATLNPALLGAGNHMMWISALAYEPLIRFTGDGQYAPALATEWGYVNGGQAEFSLTLREGAKFADGTPVDAEAVAASLNYAFKAPGGTQAWARNVTEAKATGPLTVTISCSAACAELPFLLSQNVQLGSIISPAGLADDTKLATETFGAGPYVLNKAESVTGDHWTYEANPNYWNQDGIHFDKVVYRLIADSNARLASLQSGQVDAIQNVPAKAAPGLEARGIQVVAAPTGFLGILFLDRTGKLAPELADPRVRQALNYAVDRKAITDALGYGHAKPTMQMTGEGSGVFDPALEQAYPYDPEKAKALLAEAGYPEGFTLSVETQVPMPFNADYALAVQSQWEEIGVKVDLTSDQTFSAWLENIAAKTFPAASYLYGTLPYALQVTSFFTNTGGPFNSYETDPKADAMLAEAATESPEGALQILKDLNKYSVERAFAVPLAQVNVLYAANNTVNLPEASAANAVPLITEITPK